MTLSSFLERRKIAVKGEWAEKRGNGRVGGKGRERASGRESAGKGKWAGKRGKAGESAGKRGSRKGMRSVSWDGGR